MPSITDVNGRAASFESWAALRAHARHFDDGFLWAAFSPALHFSRPKMPFIFIAYLLMRLWYISQLFLMLDCLFDAIFGASDFAIMRFRLAHAKVKLPSQPRASLHKIHRRLIELRERYRFSIGEWMSSTWLKFSLLPRISLANT